MKNKTILLTVLALVALAFAQLPTPAMSGGLPVSDLAANTGYSDPDAPILAISSAAATIVGAIPVGCHSVTVQAVGEDVNYGTSTLATGTEWPFIAANTSKEFSDLMTINPTIYLRPRSASTCTVRLLAK